jgi:hypothetical protein
MRDRLIELINNGSDKYPTLPTINGCKEEYNHFLADHLLANGVIVPPCKVGQKLYTVCTRGVNDKFIQESTVSKIVLDDFDGLRIIKKVVDERGCCFFYDVDQEQLNKTTFFSKEEAERAVKGGEG